MSVACNKTYGISGGPIDLLEGWAIIPFVDKPHFWKRQPSKHLYLSACGLERDLDEAHPGIKPLAPGILIANRCKRCGAKHPVARA